MDNLPEAPASATVKIKSKNGFEYLFTLREMNGTSLLEKLELLEAQLQKEGYTPLPQGSGFKREAKPVDYVEGRKCPECGSRLVRSTTKNGKGLIKCETNKWDFKLGKATGCPFVDWGDDKKPFIKQSQVGEEPPTPEDF